MAFLLSMLPEVTKGNIVPQNYRKIAERPVGALVKYPFQAGER
jgi:hypothetical protein